MAGYPPPYTPSPDPRGFDPRGLDPKVQRRMMKDQLRFQREQQRLQRRALRRGSIVGPLLLVAVGVLFLLVQLGRLDWWHVVDWFGRWWPLLLILAGLILLAEWAVDQHVQQRRIDQGLPVLPGSNRIVGGGVIWLLILVAILGGLAHGTARTMAWGHDNFRLNFGDLDRALGDPHDSDESLTQALPADGNLTIDNPQGDVTVTGTSDDGQMHIAVHKQVYSFKEDDAAQKSQDLRPSITGEGGRLTVRVPQVHGGHADLTIEVPRSVAVTVTAERGEVRVNSLHAPVNINANHGSVDLAGLTGSVTTHMHNDDASFAAHSVTGPVTLDGRAGDLNVSDVHGDVSLNGAFSGSTHLERINGGVHFKTHRTDFQIARLDGQVDLDTGENLSADQLAGPVVLETDDRNITLDRVQGNVRVVNSNGSVTLTNASPVGAIDVTNRRGSVDVGVPGNANFTVRAATRHGDLQNDFSLTKQGTEDHPELTGTVGKGGPEIHLQTTDGDISLRKSAVAPLPPVAPEPPKITLGSAALPKAPAAPRALSVKMKAPAAPPAPVGPGDPRPTHD